MDIDTLRVSLFSKLRAQISQHLLRSEGVSTNWARLSGTLPPPSKAPHFPEGKRASPKTIDGRQALPGSACVSLWGERWSCFGREDSSCDHGLLLSKGCGEHRSPLWLAQNCLSWRRVLLYPWPQKESVGLKQPQGLAVHGQGLLKRPRLYLTEETHLVLD